MILLITYDLHNPGRDYDSVTAEIKKARSWAHPQGSVWIVDTDLAPTTWRDKLKAAGDSNDEHFVVRLQHSWASTNLSDKIVEWLKAPERTWE